MSLSISRTFSIWPKANARLDAMVVLPSPGTEDVTTVTLCGASSPDRTKLVRNDRIGDLVLTLGAGSIGAVAASLPEAIGAMRAGGEQ